MPAAVKLAGYEFVISELDYLRGVPRYPEE
jgi:hypothetical protein